MTTNVIYRLAGFDNKTEDMVACYTIPATLVPRTLYLAGIADRPEIIGVWPLTHDQAAAIADIAHLPDIDLARTEWFLDPVAAKERAA